MPFVIEWIKYLVLQTRKKPAGGKERGLDFPLYFLHSSNSVTVTATEEDYFSCQEGIGNLSFVTSLWQLSESGVSTFFCHDSQRRIPGLGKVEQKYIN